MKPEKKKQFSKKDSELSAIPRPSMGKPNNRNKGKSSGFMNFIGKK